MSAPLQFPDFNPDAIHIGFIHIRWYALAYITGLVTGWQVMRRLVRQAPPVATLAQTDDFLTWATLGVVLGGRIGYCLFYQPSEYFAHPLEVFELWHGGMSFHGGMLGVVVALIVFCRRNAMPLLGFADRLAIVTPIGLGLGRIANFINGELWGRPAPDWLPWRMIFPRAEDSIPRHPSQIYQALMEGLILFLVVWALSRSANIRARFGTLTGSFLVGYGIARIIGELFREPDRFPDQRPWYLWHGATMGQLLSLPMILAGLAFIAFAWSGARARQA
jgi:phosphatidylglycerol:prolipoprotein diacylglycerol transferase